MKYSSLFRLFCVLLCLGSVVHIACASTLPPGYAEELIVDGIDPTRLAIAPDGRIFLAQKNGIISIVKEGNLLPDPFLKIVVDNYNERGLTGLVLDPNFELNNYFYVYYTVLNDNKNRVSRFTANGDFVVPGSELVILELDELGGTIHNGGDMVFENDSTMYVAIGDGSYGHLPQDTTSLFGKILRINSDGSIPTDNPFYDRFEGLYRSIYAIGFRNPFTIDYDVNRALLYANDVGSSDWEELIDVRKGQNYGWPIIEGPFVSGEKPESYQDAIYNYAHANGYCAIIGGAFFNPDQTNFDDRYLNKYFVGDYCKGNIRVFNPETGQIEEEFATGIDRPLSIKLGPNGDLYYLERGGIGGGSEEDNTASSNGKLYRIYFVGEGVPFIVSHPKDVLVAENESAKFEVRAGGNGAINYQWFADDQLLPNEIDSVIILDNAMLSMDGLSLKCEISIDSEVLISNEAILSVTDNSRPIVTILNPDFGTQYEAGQLLIFEGNALDPEDGALIGQNLKWKIDFHHDDHTHPFLSEQIGASGSIQIPVSGEISTNVWLRVFLTATDLEGFPNTEYVDVFPNTSSFEVSSNPVGLAISVDGKLEQTPNVTESVVGLLRVLRAPLLQEFNGQQYVFNRWADDFNQAILAFNKTDGIENFTAHYKLIEKPNGTGLMGAYQNYDAFNDEVLGEIHYQLDSIINFEWVEESPNPGIIDIDNFRVTWRGYLSPIVDGDYRLYIGMDDGARLKIDGQILVEDWQNGGKRERSNSIFLEQGKSYYVELEYYESSGAALASLSWSSPLFSKQIIPKVYLRPEPIPSDSDRDLIPRVIYDAGQLDFIIESKLITNVNWSVFNTEGKYLQGGAQKLNFGINFIDLDHDTLPQGYYFFSVNGKETSTESTAFFIAN